MHQPRALLCIPWARQVVLPRPSALALSSGGSEGTLLTSLNFGGNLGVSWQLRRMQTRPTDPLPAVPHPRPTAPLYVGLTEMSELKQDSRSQ